MSELSERLLARTSKPSGVPACVMLEDGTSFHGVARGVRGERFGEICFNTSMEGYLEVLTDPSYAGQVVVMTYPQIGNYGVCRDDAQAPAPVLRGLVVRDLCYVPSNYRSELSLPEYLVEQGVLAIEGVDTRALVRHVRDAGAMRVGLSTECLDEAELLARVRASESLVGANLVRAVSSTEPRERRTSIVAPASPTSAPVPASAPTPTSASTPTLAPIAAPAPGTPWRVVAVDCGAKESILRQLEAAGCEVATVPWDTPAGEILARDPHGVFLSNGPGDPDAVTQTCQCARDLLGKVPVFGICLGHQMLGLAAGARIEKLKFGHHGGNQPVMNLVTGRVEVTVQNHGFGIDFASLGELEPCPGADPAWSLADLREWARARIAPVVRNPRYGRIRCTHVNLNDGTPEGIEFLDVPAFSVQYHPEASPGPWDSRYLFDSFAKLMGDYHAQAL